MGDVGGAVAEIETTEIDTSENTEKVVQSTEEATGPQNVKEWAKSVDTTEPKMTIWNGTLKEGIILEDGQRYVLRQDDSLVFCTKEKYSHVSLDADLTGEDFEFRSSDNYLRIQLNKILTVNTLIEIKLTVADVEYPFSVTLISESEVHSVLFKCEM